MLNQTIQTYQVKKEIGRGGMATVYLGENSIGKKVAIKVLEKQFFHNEQIKKRFVQEAKLMVSLEHDNICTVNDLEDNDEYCAIIMEYLEGQDLGSYVNDKGAVSEKVLLGWLEQMADAMDYAHSKKVVHRDIKPSNFFLTKKGQVKIMDFGIAKQEENMMGTRTDSKMGSVIYMSPEQIKSPKYVDFKTDIYSLGVALYHLATGNIPYDIGTESEFDVMINITQKPLPYLSDKNSRINAIIQAATQKDPKDRPNKVVDLLSVKPQASDATVIETGAREKDPAKEQIVTDNTVVEETENSEKKNISPIPRENKSVISQKEIEASATNKENAIKNEKKNKETKTPVIPKLLIAGALVLLLIIVLTQVPITSNETQKVAEQARREDQLKEIQVLEKARLEEQALQQNARAEQARREDQLKEIQVLEKARLEEQALQQNARAEQVRQQEIARKKRKKSGGIIIFERNGHGIAVAETDLGKMNWRKAKAACANLVLNGFFDWRLPTKEELNMIYLKRSDIGGFSNNFFLWSSTESSKFKSWVMDFDNGFVVTADKELTYVILAVRNF